MIKTPFNTWTQPVNHALRIRRRWICPSLAWMTIWMKKRTSRCLRSNNLIKTINKNKWGRIESMTIVVFCSATPGNRQYGNTWLFIIPICFEIMAHSCSCWSGAFNSAWWAGSCISITRGMVSSTSTLPCGARNPQCYFLYSCSLLHCRKFMNRRGLTVP